MILPIIPKTLLGLPLEAHVRLGFFIGSLLPHRTQPKRELSYVQNLHIKIQYKYKNWLKFLVSFCLIGANAETWLVPITSYNHQHYRLPLKSLLEWSFKSEAMISFRVIFRFIFCLSIVPNFGTPRTPKLYFWVANHFSHSCSCLLQISFNFDCTCEVISSAVLQTSFSKFFSLAMPDRSGRNINCFWNTKSPCITINHYFY